MHERKRSYTIWDLIIGIHVSSCMGEGDVKLRKNDRMEQLRLISLMLTLQVRLEIGKGCDFTAHSRSNHRIHEPGQALWFKIQNERNAGRVSSGFKSVRSCGPCRASDNAKLDQLIRLTLDDLVVAFNAPAAWTFEALFVNRTDT